jgi:hypothetical protein
MTHHTGHRTNPVRVRAEAFHALLSRAGLSERDLAHQLGVTQQSVDRMVRCVAPASPRFVRDVGLVLAAYLDEDPAFLRSVVFTDPDRSDEPRSVLAARVAALTSEEGTQ